MVSYWLDLGEGDVQKNAKVAIIKKKNLITTLWKIQGLYSKKVNILTCAYKHGYCFCTSWS